MTARRNTVLQCALASVFAALATPGTLRAQHAITPLESVERARAALDAAVAAHGGVDAIRAARHVRVTFTGNEYHRNQSRRVAPPYDSTLRTHDLMLDLSRGRLVHTRTRGYPGGFYYTTRFVSDSTRHFAIDMRNHTYSVAQYPPADQQIGNLFMLPQFYLQAAMQNQTTQRQWLGQRRLASGAVVDAVTLTLPNGALIVLALDPATHRLRGTTSVGFDPLAGDTEVTTEFLDYETVNGVFLPRRTVTRRAGEVVSDVRLTSAMLGYDIPDSLLVPPATFTRADVTAGDDPVRPLGPGTWALRAGGSWTLAVAFVDHVLIVDAPPFGAAEILSRVTRLAPGKSIRYVVPTHHHDDHFAGVRTLGAAGAITVTTPGNVDYFRRIVSAPPSASSPAFGDPAPSARLETITNRRRVFGDGSRTVEIHDIGPNAHADEMLVAWIPGEGILFTADLTEAPASGVAQRGANAQATVQLAEYIRRQGWDVRVFAGAHAFIANRAAFDALAALPMLPPE